MIYYTAKKMNNFMQQYEWISQCWAKDGRYSRKHTLWFHLCKLQNCIRNQHRKLFLRCREILMLRGISWVLHILHFLTSVLISTGVFTVSNSSSWALWVLHLYCISIKKLKHISLNQKLKWPFLVIAHWFWYITLEAFTYVSFN